jgi:hypothetical protein
MSSNEEQRKLVQVRVDAIRTYAVSYEDHFAVWLSDEGLSEVRRAFVRFGGAPENIDLAKIRCRELPMVAHRTPHISEFRNALDNISTGCVWASWKGPRGTVFGSGAWWR